MSENYSSPNSQGYDANFEPVSDDFSARSGVLTGDPFSVYTETMTEDGYVSHPVPAPYAHESQRQYAQPPADEDRDPVDDGLGPHPELASLASHVTRTTGRFKPLVAERLRDTSQWGDDSSPGADGNDSGEGSRRHWSYIAIPVIGFIVVIVLSVLVYVHAKKAPGVPGDYSSRSIKGNLVIEDQLPPGFDIKKLRLGGLPPGEYPKAGTGTWHILPVPGGKPKILGSKVGKLFTFRIGVEDGLTSAPIVSDEESFGDFVDWVLDNPYGWAKYKATSGRGTDKQLYLRRVGPDGPTPDFEVLLTSPQTTKKLCGFDIPIESSCYLVSDQPGENKVVINLARYLLGAKTYGGDQLGYRIYMINHEVGHALGHGHLGCPRTGALAPVMMEQTFSTANNDIYKFDKSGVVSPDNKVCRPNPWPYPPHR